MSHNIKVTK